MFNLGGIQIHLYGLLIGLGVWMALEIDLFRLKNAKQKSEVESVFWWAVIGGIIGARVYHVIDFWQRYYSLFPIKVLFLWEGGLGIWGAIGGGILGIYLASRVKKINFFNTLDHLILGVPVAQAVGRLGNWANGELYGKNGEPLFAYEAILNLFLFGILFYFSGYRITCPQVLKCTSFCRRGSSMTKEKNKLLQRNDGELTGAYLIGYGVIRILLEGLRPNEIIWRIGGVPTAMLFGTAAIIAGGWLIFRKQS